MVFAAPIFLVWRYASNPHDSTYFEKISSRKLERTSRHYFCSHPAFPYRPPTTHPCANSQNLFGNTKFCKLLAPHAGRLFPVLKDYIEAEDGLDMDKPSEYGVELEEFEVLCKKSHVDNCMNNLGIQIVDELQTVVFVRIVRVGLGLSESETLKTGYLVTIHKGVANPIASLTMQFQCPYYIVKQEDIVALIREFDDNELQAL